MGAYSRILLPWDSQPQEAVGINGDSPYAQNLVTCIPLHPQWGMRNLVTNAAVTKTGLTGTVVGPHGIYPSFGASSYCDFDSPAEITSGTQPVTIAWDQYPVATSAYSTVLNWKPAGVTNAFAIYQSSADATYYFAVGARAGGAVNAAGYATAIGAATNSRLDRYVIVCTGGINGVTGSYRLFRNGVLQAQSAAPSFGASIAASARIGALNGGTDVFEGGIGNLCIWNEAFSDAKAAAYDAQRWELYTPRSIWVPVSAVAGGAYTLTADAGAYAISGQDAALVKSRIVVADAGAYSLAGQDAALTYAPAAGAYTLTAEPGAYVFAGQDAALKRGRVVSADAGAYALAGQDATLTHALPNAYTLTCDAGEYVISGQAATLTFSGGQVADTHDGFWSREWFKLKKREEKPTIAEVVAIIKESPQVLEVVRAEVERKYPQVDYAAVLANVQLQRFIAKQLIEAAQEDDDIETMLLMV